jgi:predicted transcriptional regulator
MSGETATESAAGSSVLSQEGQVKIDWLRAAVQEGLDEIDRGEGMAFGSMDELCGHIDDLARAASIEVLRARTGG